MILPPLVFPGQTNGSSLSGRISFSSNNWIFNGFDQNGCENVKLFFSKLFLFEKKKLLIEFIQLIVAPIRLRRDAPAENRPECARTAEERFPPPIADVIKRFFSSSPTPRQSKLERFFARAMTVTKKKVL